MTTSVKILHMAENGRTVKVSIGKKGFTTPTRAVTHRELEKFSYLVANHVSRQDFASVDSPPCEVQETVLDFHDSDVAALTSRNEVLGQRTYAISSRNRNGNSRIKICNILLRSQNEVIPDRAIEFMTIMQIKPRCLDIVTVPDPNYRHADPDMVLAAIDTAQKTLNGYGFDYLPIMPHLDLATQPVALQARLQALIDAGCDCIAFRYRPYAYASMAKVADILSDKDIWTHLSDVQKKLPSSPILPQIHIMPYFSFDTISSYKYPPGARASRQPEEVLPIVAERSDPGGGRGGIVRSDDGQVVTPIQDSRRTLENETRFDSSALGFLTRRQHRQLLGESLNCNCFLCRGLDIDGFYDEYGMIDGRPARAKLRLHQEVHEIYASHSEFKLVQERLKDCSYTDYLWEKPVVQRYTTSIPGINGQSRLDRFSQSSA